MSFDPNSDVRQSLTHTRLVEPSKKPDRRVIRSATSPVSAERRAVRRRHVSRKILANWPFASLRTRGRARGSRPFCL